MTWGTQPKRPPGQPGREGCLLPSPPGWAGLHSGKAFMRGALRAVPAAVLASADVLWQALERVK